jgi:hypothetical protein
MMDIGDLNRDGKSEIITGLSSGLINVLNGKTEKVWTKYLSSPPIVVKAVNGQCETWLCAGCEDGTILILDSLGIIKKLGKVTGQPADLRVLQTFNGPLAMMTTDKGEVVGIRFPCIWDENSKEKVFNAFPNPARDFIEINFINNYSDEIHLYNQMGKLVMSQKGQGKVNRISTSGLEKGLYFIKIQIGDKFYTQKIMIM